MTINFKNFDGTNDGTNEDGKLRTPYEEIADDIESNVISVDPDDILYQYIEQVVHEGEELLGEDI